MSNLPPYPYPPISAAEARLRQAARRDLSGLLKAVGERVTPRRKPRAAAVAKAKPALDRDVAKRKRPEPSALAKAIVARHPSARRASVAKAGRKAGQLDFKRSNDTRKETSRRR